MDESRLVLPKFWTINTAEKYNVGKAMKSPLSGYLGGIDKAGYFVTRLQDQWCGTFGVKHAIACNSATSGLLAACMAAGIGPGDTVWTTAYSMSATAACAKVLGARLVFMDIETTRLSLDTKLLTGPSPKSIIVTNLFGHPAYLSRIRSWCDSNNVIMIEDAAQSPFAMEDGKYAGTVGHIGIFSFNVHKHLQAGEGGIIVTSDSRMAEILSGCINHGELGTSGTAVGLNLRMTEPVAAIACAQLLKADRIIESRIALAEELTDMVKDVPWITPPRADTGCKHVYYIWAALLDDPEQKRRFGFTNRLQMDGVPMKAGYTKPLHGVFGEQVNLPMVQRVEYKQIITFEVCSWDPQRTHLKRMRQIIKEAAESTG